MLIGIDIGTSGTKTVLFDENGRAVSSHTEEYPLYQPKNGWAEQEPNDWWKAVYTSVYAVIHKSGISPSEIKGIGLSGQMHGLVMLDEKGEPIRKSIIWCDGRTEKECDEITEIVGRDRLVGITANPALTGFTASKIRWVMNNEPENYGKCKKILLPKDYIRYKLTGEFATEVSDASGMQLLDVPERKWSDELLSLLGIDKSLLGEVYESYEISGKITAQAAELTGLLTGTPVAGGAGDQAASAVGNGIVTEGLISATIGTSGVVFAHTDKPHIDPLGRVHTFCHAVPGCWHIMGVTQAAGLSLKWFRDNFCKEEIAAAEAEGIDSYVLLDRLAEKSGIGANGVVFMPYLMGERTPHLNPKARGAFFGLSAIHDKGDMVRSILEGVAFSLNDCLSIIQDMNIFSEAVRVSGGGGKSPLWRRILSDTFCCDTETVASEGGALGVALLAGVGTGVYSSVEEACKATIITKNRISPDDCAVPLYSKRYELYKKLYRSLKDCYGDL